MRTQSTAQGIDGRSSEVSTGRSRTAPPTTKRLVWGISIAAALIVALVGAGVVAVLQGTRSIPVVANVQGAVVDGSAVFTWDDPGIQGGDAYLVAVDGDPEPVQRVARVEVPVHEGDRVCVTVTVTREGKTGAPSAERCIDVTGVG